MLLIGMIRKWVSLASYALDVVNEKTKNFWDFSECEKLNETEYMKQHLENVASAWPT